MPNTQANHIFECCKKGKTQQLLDALANSDQSTFIDERNNTLLCMALKHGQWQTYTTLLDSNHSFNPSKPLLISACQYNKDNVMGIELAIEFNADVNVTSTQQRTALMTACLLGHTNKAQELINKGAQIDLQDSEGNTALIEAVQSRNKKTLELILKQNPVINQANHLKDTALIVSIRHKTPIEDMVKSLLEAGADPEQNNNNQKSAWLIAKQKHPKISRLIEKHLNDINQIELPFFSNDYKTPEPIDTRPTELEVEPIENTIIVDSNTQLIEEPSEEIRVDSTEKTPEKPTEKPILKPFEFVTKKVKRNNKQEWFHAAKSGNLGGLNRMIIDGIDIDCIDDKGCTALIRASGHSRRAVVSFLLQQNANVEMRSDNGSTALSSSIIGNCRRVAGLLLDNNANPNALGPSDYDYATIAAAQWNDGMLSILYRNGSDIFVLNDQQQNLLHIIALAAEFYNNFNNAKTSIQFLLDHGMDINATDENGNTPLMILCGAHKKKYAVDDRNIASIVHSILKWNAAPAITNKAGNSAIDATRLHELQQTKGVLMNALSWNTD